MTSPTNLRYTKEHEWARLEDDGTISVGITAHAQDSLGDVVFVELPVIGDDLSEEDKFGVVESVKTVSDLFSPCAGTVIAVNEALENTPELVNTNPYDDGWMVRIQPVASDALDALMDAQSYDAFVAAESN